MLLCLFVCVMQRELANQFIANAVESIPQPLHGVRLRMAGQLAPGVVVVVQVENPTVTSLFDAVTNDFGHCWEGSGFAA